MGNTEWQLTACQAPSCASNLHINPAGVVSLHVCLILHLFPGIRVVSGHVSPVGQSQVLGELKVCPRPHAEKGREPEYYMPPF